MAEESNTGIQLSSLVTLTRKYINQYIPASADQDDFAEESEAIIEAYVDTAVRIVAKQAPVRLLTVTQLNSQPVTSKRPDGRYVAQVRIPASVLKLSHVMIPRQGGMTVRQSEFLMGNTPEYEMELSTMPGIGSGEARPKAYLVQSEGSDMLEVHSFTDTAMAQRVGVYVVEVPELSDSKTYQLDDTLAQPIALQAAQLYLAAMGDDKAQGVAAAAALAMASLTGAVPTNQIINNQQ